MKIDEALRRTAVIGAAGRMGRGIALLLLEEMAFSDLRLYGKCGSGNFILTLIDAAEQALFPLRDYLREELRRRAEKKINLLRELYSGQRSMTDNGEIIEDYVRGAADILNLVGKIEAAEGSKLIFEAVFEDEEEKVALFSRLASLTTEETYFFSNTSSIPIAVLAEKSTLGERLIGFHFYNPPPAQKLLEIIPSAGGSPLLRTMAFDLAGRLGKVAVEARDIAGFIGNGYLIREINFAFKKAEELFGKFSAEESIRVIDLVTRYLLVRPMGIFRLVDYIGLETVANIMRIMGKYLGESFNFDFITLLLKSGASSFYGEKQLFSVGAGKYVNIPDISISGGLDWKEVKKRKDRDVVLRKHFAALATSRDFFVLLAREFIERDRVIAGELLAKGVVNSRAELDLVLKNGFHYLWTF